MLYTGLAMLYTGLAMLYTGLAMLSAGLQTVCQSAMMKACILYGWWFSLAITGPTKQLSDKSLLQSATLGSLPTTDSN